MLYAVTHASGQLGSTIIKLLTAKVGHGNVIGIARTPSKAAHLGVETRKGDYNSKKDFDTALQGVDRLLIVSNSGDPEPRKQQHHNIIDAAKNAGVSKIVYVSIANNTTEGTAFSAIVASNRVTERDVQNSGLDFVIGRNGIYIEPDLEYVSEYEKRGAIWNCANDGKCGYTGRSELAEAYANLLIHDDHNGKVLNLTGPGITQADLVSAINAAFGTSLVFENMTFADYLAERKAAIGDFMGTVIAGIYDGIAKGNFDTTSDFEAVAGRPHKSLSEMIKEFRESASNS